MENKKEIYRTGLMIGVLTFWLNIICMPIETLILGGVSLCLNILNRKNYRVKAGIVCTLLGMVLSVGYLLFEIYYETQGIQALLLGAVVPQLNSMSLSALCEETSPESKHASFIYGGAICCMRVYYGNEDNI